MSSNKEWLKALVSYSLYNQGIAVGLVQAALRTPYSV